MQLEDEIQKCFGAGWRCDAVDASQRDPRCSAGRKCWWVKVEQLGITKTKTKGRRTVYRCCREDTREFEGRKGVCFLWNTDEYEIGQRQGRTSRKEMSKSGNLADGRLQGRIRISPSSQCQAIWTPIIHPPRARYIDVDTVFQGWGTSISTTMKTPPRHMHHSSTV